MIWFLEKCLPTWSLMKSILKAAMKYALRANQELASVINWGEVRGALVTCANVASGWALLAYK